MRYFLYYLAATLAASIGPAGIAHANDVGITIGVTVKSSNPGAIPDFSASGSVKDGKWHDEWRQLFGFTNEDLKKAFKKINGKEPSSIHYGGKFQGQKFSGVSAILVAESATLASLSVNSVVGGSDYVYNYSNEPQMPAYSIQVSKSDTQTSSWTNSKSLEISASLQVETTAEDITAKDTFTIADTFSYSETQSKSQTSSVSATYSTPVNLSPKKCALVQIFVTQGDMPITIKYTARLTGSVLGNYGKTPHKGHYNYVYTIEDLLKHIDHSNSATITQSIDYGFYTNASTVISDEHPIDSKFCKSNS